MTTTLSMSVDLLPQPASGRVRRWQWGLLGLIILVGLAARLWKIGGESFWADEFISAQISAGHGYQLLDLPRGQVLPPQPDLYGMKTAGSWAELYRSMDRSTHPPLYFILLRFWRQCTGAESDGMLRAFSALASLISIVIAFDAVRMLQRSTGAALWACLVLAVSNGQVQFAQEARGYALLCTFMLGCCAAIIRIERLGINRRRCAALAVCALGMLLTHYLGFSIAGLIALYATLRLPKAARNAALLSIVGAGVATLLLWGPSMLTQARTMHVHLAWMLEPREGHLWNTITRLALLQIGFLVRPSWQPDALCYVAAVLYVLPLFFLRRQPDLLLWTILFIGGVALIAAGDLWRGSIALMHPRYTLPAATAACILLPPLLQSTLRNRWLRQLAPAGLVLACVAALPLSYNRDKQDWRALARYVDRYCDGDSTILFYPNGIDGDWYAALLQLGLTRYMQNRTHPVAIFSQPANSMQLQALAGRTVDIISGSLPPEQILPGCVLVHQAYFPQIGCCSRVLLPSTGPGL